MGRDTLPVGALFHADMSVRYPFFAEEAKGGA